MYGTADHRNRRTGSSRGYRTDSDVPFAGVQGTGEASADDTAGAAELRNESSFQHGSGPEKKAHEGAGMDHAADGRGLYRSGRLSGHGDEGTSVSSGILFAGKGTGGHGTADRRPGADAGGDRAEAGTSPDHGEPKVQESGKDNADPISDAGI